MELEEVGDELYALPPDEFTAAREERSKQLRADGDPELAKQVHALRKPSVAAWLVNQLVRQHTAEVELLIDLGLELRAGLMDVTGDELRELTQRRYQLVSALVDQARATARARAQRVSDDVAAGVRSTLEATLSDPASAEAVSAGQLTSALEVSGFGIEGTDDLAIARRRHSEPPGAGGGQVADLSAHRSEKERRQAEAAVQAAEASSRQAHTALDDADARLTATQQQQQAAAGEIKRLQQELNRAQGELGQRTEAAHAAREAKKEAEKAARAADRELADARERLRGLTS